MDWGQKSGHKVKGILNNWCLYISTAFDSGYLKLSLAIKIERGPSWNSRRLIDSFQK